LGNQKKQARSKESRPKATHVEEAEVGRYNTYTERLINAGEHEEMNRSFRMSFLKDCRVKTTKKRKVQEEWTTR